MLALAHENELAALAAALLWSFSALAWSFSGRRIGSVPVTVIRLVFASAILLGIQWAVTGSCWPNLPAGPMAMLAVSGLFGVAAADMLFFRALVLIGPRIGMLILSSLSPIATAIIAAGAGEMIGPWAVAGILVTVGGVAIVVSEKHPNAAWPSTPRDYRRGVILSLGAVLCGAASYVMGRTGMQWAAGAMPQGQLELSAATIRVATACVACWVGLPLVGRLRVTLRGFADRKAILIVLAGSIVGPVLGIWMLMVALNGIAAGVAVALVSTSPIMMIPITFVAYRDRPTLRGIVGTCVAIGGIFVLMWK